MSAAQRALAAIQDAIAAERYRITPHFRSRLAERGLLWVDLLSVFESPRGIQPGGEEKLGRPKWIVSGEAVDGLAVDVVCVLDRDAKGRLVVLVTIFYRRGSG